MTISKAFLMNIGYGETVFLGMFDALNTNLLTKIEKK
jgi:hypothetical protein